MTKNKVSDEQLSKAVSESKTIFEALTLLGVNCTSRNHTEYGKRINDLGIDVSHFKTRTRRRIDGELVKVAGRPKISDSELAEAVARSFSVFGVLREFGLRCSGGSHAHLSRRIKRLGLDTGHFTGQAWLKGGSSSNRKSSEEILVLRTGHRRQSAPRLRRALIERGVEYKCSKCGQEPEWLGNPLTLDVDHINENWLDDRIENLRFLCPNCHSQFSRNLIK